jgi:hypothetical protein
MLVALAIALSIAGTQVPAIEVPFVPQTEALCGGAAAAMVFRYWGDARAGAQQFAPLVVHRSGGVAGIETETLVRDIRTRGWRTERIEAADPSRATEALRQRLDARQPVIVLLAERGNRYHYVVVTGLGGDAAVVHDPSWGPSRSIPLARFTRLWAASGYWSVVVLLPEGGLPTAVKSPSSTSESAVASTDPCDAALSAAIDEVGARGIDAADAVLEPLRRRCPGAAGPLRELAGVRFAQRRWKDAAAYATQALDRDPYDEYALEVLGASLFMRDDAVGALRAWNRIGRPTLDLVRIDGLRHSRYQSMIEALRLEPGRMLTADAFVQASRRLEDLPNRSSSRARVHPAEDGTAAVDIAIVERSLPHGALEWAGAGVHAGIEREIALTAPGFAGQGDVWSASWRWWNERPRVALAFAAPRVGGLFGVWTIDASWEAQTYALNGASVREEQTHGGLTVSDWLTGSVRYSLNTSVDGWSGGRRTAAFGGSIERRWFGDGLAATAHATQWIPVKQNPDFDPFLATGVRLTARSTTDQHWSFEGIAGVERVGEAAPLALWPGAGEGRARPLLLRAHPLLNDGVVEADGRTAFGRTLRYATGEAQRWLPKPALVRFGVAGFVDVASAARQAALRSAVTQVDVGVGLRVRIPGSPDAMRVDYAHGLQDGANAITVGWSVLR